MVIVGMVLGTIILIVVAAMSFVFLPNIISAWSKHRLQMVQLRKGTKTDSANIKRLEEEILSLKALVQEQTIALDTFISLNNAGHQTELERRLEIK